MKMIRCIAGLICVCALFAFPSFNKSPATVVLGNWLRIATPPFSGPPRSGAYCFTIGNIAYVGLGWGPEPNVSGIYHRDSYAYNLSNSYWTQLADFPGEVRE